MGRWRPEREHTHGGHISEMGERSFLMKEDALGNGGKRDDPAARYRTSRREHWDNVAKRMDVWKGWGGYYHKRIECIFRFLVPSGQKVIEIGCAQGDLLAAVQPSLGVGVDFSEEMVKRARKKHPYLHFIVADAHDLPLRQKFDVIILSDVVNDLWDVQAVFQGLAELVTPNTRLIINSYSRLWELPLWIVQKLGMGRPTLFQNWLTVEDMKGLLTLAEFEVITSWGEILWPLDTPFLARFLNTVVVRLWPFRVFSLTNFLVARPRMSRKQEGRDPIVSVVIPVKDEAGNIPDIFRRVPEMGGGTELVFVEGHSTDNTYHVIEETMALYPQRRCTLLRQSGSGKGDAVRRGFANAHGDILMILDGDLTVPPEDLPRFYDALVSGKGEFINGVRLVYPMEGEAMRFLNLLGNKCFSLVFTWMLRQPIKDTLCGTKALWKSDYERIAANRSYFGDFDPFGDFDLLFGAAKLNLKIVEMPVRYRERVYGHTKISRWRHGWMLLKMTFFAVRRITFI